MALDRYIRCRGNLDFPQAENVQALSTSTTGRDDRGSIGVSGFWLAGGCLGVPGIARVGDSGEQNHSAATSNEQTLIVELPGTYPGGTYHAPASSSLSSPEPRLAREHQDSCTDVPSTATWTRALHHFTTSATKRASGDGRGLISYRHDMAHTSSPDAVRNFQSLQAASRHRPSTSDQRLPRH
ncbi:hypothetical protein ANO11243_077200 [Dothideomycetidae sp. 11243]|nr:hypothetical protein ANO11243_077200 [fungal sp. No.11243]